MNRRKMVLRAAGALLAIASLALALGSCAKAAPKEKVALRLWCLENEGMEKGYKALIEEYQKLHPEVSIKIEKFEYGTYIQTLQTAFPANNEADILELFGTWVGAYKDRLATAPSGVITPAKARERILAATLGGYLFGDALYGIPQEFNMEAGAVLVNTKIAEEAGVLGAIEGWKTFDDVAAAMSKMTQRQDGSMTRAGMCFTTLDGLGYTFLSLLKQYGAQLVDASGDFDPGVLDSAQARQALAVLKSWVDAGLVDPKLYNESANFSGEALMKGQAAAAIIGAWAIPEYGADYEEVVKTVRYYRLPYASKEPAFVAASGWGLAVSKNSKAQDAAWDFVKFAALDPKNARSWNVASGTLPALRENTEGEGKKTILASFLQFETHLDLMRYGSPVGHMQDSDMIVYDIIAGSLLSYLQGNATLDETLAKIRKQAAETQS